MNNKANEWSKSSLQSIQYKYHIYLNRFQVQNLNGRLFLCKPIMVKGKLLAFIVFSKFLRTVQQFENDKIATRKYKGTELYALPPALFPVEPLDTLNQ